MYSTSNELDSYCTGTQVQNTDVIKFKYNLNLTKKYRTVSKVSRYKECTNFIKSTQLCLIDYEEK